MPKIVWDEPKRARNIDSRGLDFADLDMDFFENSVVLPAREGRLKALGLFEGIVLAVIFRPLGTEAISVVSMRRASRAERRIYGSIS